MKCLIRYLSLFCCLVLLFTCFSVPVKAERLDIKSYQVTHTFHVYNEWNSFGGNNAFTFYPGNGEREYRELEWVSNYAVPYTTTKYTVTTNLRVSYTDSTPLVLSGQPAVIRISNPTTYYFFQSQNEEGHYERDIDYIWTLVGYSDGTKEYLGGDVRGNVADGYTLTLSFTPSKDVTWIEFFTTVEGNVPNNNSHWYITAYQGELNGDNTYSLSIEQETKEEGLLGGILGELSSGINKIGGWFSDLGNGISNVFNAIKDLPATIWSFIENGLKSLFVPDEEYMTGYKQKWEDLLADRLGAVYQVVQITFGAWEDIQTADQMDTINIPVVTIPLLDSQEFSFGGYDVKIVPDGFDILVTALKSIVGIVCTIMFINGLRKRYDEIMGVEQ